MEKPRRMRSHRSAGALTPATVWPLAALAVMGCNGPDGYSGVWLAVAGSVVDAALSVGAVVAQPVNHSRLASPRMCRSLIEIRFSIGAARPVRLQVRAGL